ncbi:MAG: L,D-transpeptidase family protein [Kiritimatiellales bacterium]
MADIYVRPRGSRHNRRGSGPVIAAVLILALATGGMWWFFGRSRTEKPAEATPAAQIQSKPAATTAQQPAPRTTATPPTATSSAQQLFSQAQNLTSAGKLLDARNLLSEVMAATSDESLKNNALRVQGRLNIQLLLSPGIPSPEKKNYVIQPGDSLDKIARQNKTTIELLRKMNNISGNLIYPGNTLQIPAAPFTVQVNKTGKYLDLLMNGKLFKRYIVGLGVFGKTPAGNFVTDVHQMNPDWTSPAGKVYAYGDPENILGTRWMSFKDSTRPEIRGFGIHGTSVRDSIGADTSNGCVRMLNEDIEELYMLIPRGTTMAISE